MRSTTTALLTLALLSAACSSGEGPDLILGPAGATTFDDLVLTVVDGNDDRYAYSWQVEGEDEPREGLDSVTVPASETEKDQIWTVTATRGNASSTASITIGNTRPSAEVSISPANPTAADVVTATGTGLDDDGDPTYVEYGWQRLVDESWVASGLTSRNLPAESTRRGQRWRVIVTPFDGDEAGLPAVLEFDISNAAPVVKSLELSRDRTTSVGSVAVDAVITDADEDSWVAEYQWYRNGEAIDGATGRVLEPGAFTRGDELYVQVRGNDGEDVGAWRASAVVPVDNTPPEQAGAAITPEAPYSDEDLLCSLTTPSTDADGDTVSYRVEWEVDGAPFTASSTTTIEGDTVLAAQVGADEIWTCIMVAYDEDGAEGITRVSTFVDARSGCADGTTEVEWSTSVEGCAASAPDTWAAFVADPSAVCADGWTLAGASIVNTVLAGTGYTDDWSFGFDGEGCEEWDAFATTPDGSTTSRGSCVWRRSHHTRLSSEETEIDGLVCEKI